jgi:hypothetical protein
LEDVLFLSSIVIGHDARLQLGELVPTSLIVDMANFDSFDVYDIDLSKVMNDSNLNFVLLQMTSKSIIDVDDLDQFLTKKSTAVSLFIDVHIHFSLCDFLAFKRWPIATWSSRITSFSFRWRIFSKAGRACAQPRSAS